MTRTSRWIIVIAVSGAVAGGVGVGLAAAATRPDTEQPITGDALDRASAAALAHTGGGRVTDTEIGDEESYYEVEVTLTDGRQVDIQLDQDFQVVGSKVDGPADDAGENGGGED